MPTTSLKLPKDVKKQAAAVASHQGISLHAFMVGAIRDAVAHAEKREQFIADAITARREAVESDEGYSADEVHAYLRAKVQGEPAERPEVKAWQ